MTSLRKTKPKSYFKNNRPTPHPALMEDLATARMSVAQLAQRVLHAARCEDTGAEHTVGGVRRLLQVTA